MYNVTQAGESNVCALFESLWDYPIAKSHRSLVFVCIVGRN